MQQPRRNPNRRKRQVPRCIPPDRGARRERKSGECAVSERGSMEVSVEGHLKWEGPHQLQTRQDLSRMEILPSLVLLLRGKIHAPLSPPLSQCTTLKMHSRGINAEESHIIRSQRIQEKNSFKATSYQKAPCTHINSHVIHPRATGPGQTSQRAKKSMYPIDMERGPVTLSPEAS